MNLIDRKPRSDGARRRAVILDTAARLASIEGLSGLSLGRLAEAAGMSKSGLFAHFGSKEELQLATVGEANRVFDRTVLARAKGTTGAKRVRALIDAYFDYVRYETFPGGCFFAAAYVETATLPPAVRDALLAAMDRWLGELEAAIREAQAEGAVATDEDPRQLAFELESAFFFANAQFAVLRNPEPLDRARQMIDRWLA